MKEHHERCFCHASPLDIGVFVLFRQLRPANKFQSPFHPDPHQVTAIKGTMITAQRGQQMVTRNIFHFKQVSQPLTQPGPSSADQSSTLPSRTEPIAGLISPTSPTLAATIPKVQCYPRHAIGLVWFSWLSMALATPGWWGPHGGPMRENMIMYALDKIIC